MLIITCIAIGSTWIAIVSFAVKKWAERTMLRYVAIRFAEEARAGRRLTYADLQALYEHETGGQLQEQEAFQVADLAQEMMCRAPNVTPADAAPSVQSLRDTTPGRGFRDRDVISLVRLLHYHVVGMLILWFLLPSVKPNRVGLVIATFAIGIPALAYLGSLACCFPTAVSFRRMARRREPLLRA